MLLLEFIASATLLLAAWLLARKSIKGFYVGAFSNVLWFAFAFLNAHYIQTVLSVVFIVINIYGVVTWRKESNS